MNLSQSPKNAFEQLYGKPLTPQQVAEMRFNLKNYVKTLIEMDKQYQAWLKEQADTKNDQKQSSDS
ncbi:MAG TPA: hypothetical protein VFN56_01185 [Candidatus Saccharimonadales bacterium]|nr:hypothetical protein [Candidatus Saccharimonadales bacterium]